MIELIFYAAESDVKDFLALLMYCFTAFLLIGSAIYYFYSITETSQVIKVLKKYQHTEFQELEVLDVSAAGSRIFMLIGTGNQKRVTINRFGKIREINE